MNENKKENEEDVLKDEDLPKEMVIALDSLVRAIIFEMKKALKEVTLIG